MIRDYLGGLLLIALLLACLAALWYRGSAATAQGERDAAVTAKKDAEAERDDIKGVLAIERAKASRMAEIDEQHQEGKNNAEAAGTRVTADLLADNLRLRQHWQGCVATSALSGAATSASLADAAAQLRAADAGASVRDADECDATIRGLQRVTQEDRR